MNVRNKQTQDLAQTLKELVAGTVLWALIICLVTVWFADSKFVFVVSMAAGAIGAVAMAVHMHRAIEYAMEMPDDSAGKYLRKQSVLRMGGAAVLILLAYYLKGNIVAIFLGLLSLKPGAYTQPLLHKLKKGR